MSPCDPSADAPPPKPQDKSDRTLVHCLSLTLRAANRYLCLKLHQAGLTALVPSHGDILVALFNHEPIAMQKLAETIDRDPSTVTALVKKLLDAGYVRTQKSAEDRRVTEVLLTPEGRNLRQSFEEISTELITTQNQGLTADQFAVTRQTLTQIKDNFVQALERESEDV